MIRYTKTIVSRVLGRRLLSVAGALAASLLLLASSCTKEDSPEAVQEGYEDDGVSANLTFIFKTSAGPDTKSIATKAKDEITDVKTEDNQPHEARIDDALVLLYESGSDPTSQNLKYVFSFAGRSNNNYTLSEGGLSYNVLTGLATSQTKKVDPGEYHLVVVSNLLANYFKGTIQTQADLLSQMKSLSTLDDCYKYFSNLELKILQADNINYIGYGGMDEDGEDIKVNVNVNRYRMPELKYSDRPDEDPEYEVSLSDLDLSDPSQSGNFQMGEKEYKFKRLPHVAFYEEAEFEIPEGYTNPISPYRKYIKLIRPVAKLRVNITNIDKSTGMPYPESEEYFLSILGGVFPYPMEIDPDDEWYKYYYDGKLTLEYSNPFKYPSGLVLGNFLNSTPLAQWEDYRHATENLKPEYLDIQQMFYPKQRIMPGTIFDEDSGDWVRVLDVDPDGFVIEDRGDGFSGYVPDYYPYFFASKSKVYDKTPYPILFYLMAGNNPEVFDRPGYGPYNFSPYELQLDNPSSYMNGNSYKEGVTAGDVYKAFLDKYKYNTNGYDGELFSTYIAQWSPYYASYVQNWDNTIIDRFGFPVPRGIDPEPNSEYGGATYLYISFEKRIDVSGARWRVGWEEAPRLSNADFAAEKPKPEPDPEEDEYIEENDSKKKYIPINQLRYWIPIYNPDSDPIASTPNLMESHPYLKSTEYTRYTILRNYLYVLNLVFKGDAGLDYSLTITPQEYVEHDFDTDWIIN